MRFGGLTLRTPPLLVLVEARDAFLLLLYGGGAFLSILPPLANASTQIVALSHDAVFLKQLWEKCPQNSRAALQIIYHPATGSKLSIFDLDDACRGRAAAELDDLLKFRSTGTGNLREIIKKLRVVLETYFRSNFPGAFLPTTISGRFYKR